MTRVKKLRMVRNFTMTVTIAFVRRSVKAIPARQCETGTPPDVLQVYFTFIGAYKKGLAQNEPTPF
jgi:hypothetical protein